MDKNNVLDTLAEIFSRIVSGNNAFQNASLIYNQYTARIAKLTMNCEHLSIWLTALHLSIHHIDSP